MCRDRADKPQTRRQEDDMATDESTGNGDRKGVDRITVHQGAIRSAEADRIEVRQGVIALARGREIAVSQGATGVALGGRVELVQGAARFVAARDVHLEQAGAMTVLANSVTVGPRSGVVFLLAREVRGDVRPVFDWRGGVAFGAAFAIVASVLRLGRGAKRRGAKGPFGR
jgi:hypothetical protein